MIGTEGPATVGAQHVVVTGASDDADRVATVDRRPAPTDPDDHQPPTRVASDHMMGRDHICQ
jgi:hypothetical protein